MRFGFSFSNDSAQLLGGTFFFALGGKNPAISHVIAIRNPIAFLPGDFQCSFQMNEISRCCRVLGVKHGASLEDVKKTYRDLVQVWHPDRFSNNERLRLKAEEQLKEINNAHDHLVAHAFQDGFLVEPEEVAPEGMVTIERDAAVEPVETAPSSAASSDWADEPAGTPEPTGSRVSFWALIVVALGLGTGLFWYLKTRSRPPDLEKPKPAGSSVAAVAPAAAETNPPAETIPTPAPIPAPASTSNPSSKDILPGTTVPARNRAPIAGDLLATMTPTKNLFMTQEAEGTLLRMRGIGAPHLLTPQSYRPPFTIRTRAKTDGDNLRLHCGGQIIFNWEVRQTELRVLEPLVKKNTGVANQGLISKNEWHVIILQVQSNGLKLFVDGKLRYQNQNDNRTLDARVGIGPRGSTVTVDYFVVEKR